MDSDSFGGNAYSETADIVRGICQLNPRFRELAIAISERFKVDVVNVREDTMLPDRKRRNHERPRLWIWLRTREEANSFNDRPFNFDETKQLAIVHMAGGMFPPTDPPFVVFTSFESPALEEASVKVTDDQLERLRLSLANEAIWKVKAIFFRVVFFVYTDQEVAQFRDSAEARRWEDAIWPLFAEHDEFGFMAREKFRIELDSKQAFDTVAQGNWGWYAL